MSSGKTKGFLKITTEHKINRIRLVERGEF